MMQHLFSADTAWIDPWPWLGKVVGFILSSSVHRGSSSWLARANPNYAVFPGFRPSQPHNGMLPSVKILPSSALILSSLCCIALDRECKSRPAGLSCQARMLCLGLVAKPLKKLRASGTADLLRSDWINITVWFTVSCEFSTNVLEGVTLKSESRFATPLTKR